MNPSTPLFWFVLAIVILLMMLDDMAMTSVSRPHGISPPLGKKYPTSRWYQLPLGGFVALLRYRGR